MANGSMAPGPTGSTFRPIRPRHSSGRSLFYDVSTRSRIDNNTEITDRSSQDLVKNSDGSVDV